MRFRSIYVAFSAILLASACTTKTMPIPSTYTGSIGSANGAGLPVALVLNFADQKGQPYAENSYVVQQYRLLAADALKKSGYSVNNDAAITVSINLAGKTENGIVNNKNSTARNMAVSAVTLGIGCSEMEHVADAGGSIEINNGGSSVWARAVDLNGASTSCHSKLNPGWLADQQQAGVEMYERAVVNHIGAWLPDAGEKLNALDKKGKL